MFDTLSDKLQHALGDLGGKGRLDDEKISKAMREIRLALLEADVNFKVAKDFVAQVKERASGQEVLKGLDPGQQIVKIVHEELTALIGSGDSRLAFGNAADRDHDGRPAGLGQDDDLRQARAAAPEGRQDAAARRRRPAAPRRDRAARAARPRRSRSRSTARTRRIRSRSRRTASRRRETAGQDVLILDTAGRLHIDEELMEELRACAAARQADEVLLVLDAMTGQDAVNVAQAFQERVAFDGVVLTKLDGDARGGAALSVRAVTGKPIKSRRSARSSTSSRSSIPSGWRRASSAWATC